MNFIFEATARASISQSMEQKHQQLIEGLKTIESPWGIVHNDANLAPPKFGDEITAIFSFNKILGKGVKGDVMYRYRRLLQDDSGDDDRIYVEFNPNKIDLVKLLDHGLKKYVLSFQAYSVSVYNKDLIYEDFEKSRNINRRKSIFRFYQINFWDEQLCAAALNKTPIEIFQRLNGHIEKVELFSNGIIVIGSSKPLSVEESDQVDLKISSLLR